VMSPAQPSVRAQMAQHELANFHYAGGVRGLEQSFDGVVKARKIPRRPRRLG